MITIRIQKPGLLWILGIVVLAGMLLAACSESGDNDESTTVATTTESQEPTATTTPIPPLATSTESEPTVTLEAAATETLTVDPSPTTVPTDAPTPTEVPPTATPTVNPAPQGGAELLISESPIFSMVGGTVDGSILYAITEDGLSRSEDGGLSWDTAGDDPGGDLITSTTNSAILYAGDRSSCGRGISFHEFSRSLDSGQTWETIPASMDIQPMFAFEDTEGEYVYGTSCGLSISDNSGESWAPSADLAGEEIFSATADRVTPDNLLYVVGVTEGGTGRVFSLDISDRMAPDLNGALTQFFGDAGVGVSNGRIVVAASSRIGISDDGGDTWTWTRDGLENVTFSVDPLNQEIPEDEQSEFFRFNIVQIDPTNNDNIWIAGNHGAFQSIDGGVTWALVGDGTPVDSLVISSLTDRVYISSAGTTQAWTLAGN